MVGRNYSFKLCLHELAAFKHGKRIQSECEGCNRRYYEEYQPIQRFLVLLVLVVLKVLHGKAIVKDDKNGLVQKVAETGAGHNQKR